MIWETQTFLRMFLYLFFESQDGFGSLNRTVAQNPFFHLLTVKIVNRLN